MIINKSDENSAQKTAEILKNGGITIIPTDTVYGFSGIVDLKLSAENFKTDCKIRAIKGREETKPLIQLIAKPEDIKLYSDDKIPETLLSKWPGALTIIVRIKEGAALAENAVPQSRTVAFRCPGDEWLRKVIELCGGPIYSTSVNKSGCPVLETPAQIIQTFGSQADLIVQDGNKTGALPSTLVMLENGSIKILRQGAVKV